MQAQYLNLHTAGGILYCLINRPDKRNALSQDVLEELRQAFTDYRDDETLIAAVVTGAGEKCFAAGGDLKEFDGLRSRAAIERMTQASSAALDALRDFPVPVIGALNGDAIGGGAELAAACDMRLFAHHARIAFVQGTLCISPAWGGGSDLIRIVGGAQALRLLSRADFIDATAAETLGLAQGVAAPGQSLSLLLAEFLEPIKSRKPQVMRAFKSLVIAHRKTSDWHKIRELEAALLVSTWNHQDHWDAAEKILARIAGGKK